MELTFLSPRQSQALSAKERGLTLKEIGAELGVSVSAVKTHLSKVHHKTGARPARVNPCAWTPLIVFL